MKNRFFQVDQSQHGYLTFISDGHEGLCSISTVDRQNGIIKITAPDGREAEVDSFILAMTDEIGMKEVKWDA